MPRSQSSHREGSGLGGVHASSPDLAAARESTAVNSGSDSAAAATPEGCSFAESSSSEDDCPSTDARSTSDPLSARQMKRWARRETAQQNHRGAAQNSCCGRSERSVGTDPAESSHCSPQIAQSTSRWFSARGREASAGSDRGSLSHPREERERRDRSAAMVTRSERTHKPSTNAASARWMPRH